MPTVHAIDPTRHPLPAALVCALPVDEFPFALRRGAWDLPLATHPVEDVARPISSYAGTLALKLEVPPDCFVGCANYFPTGGGMAWHTDSHRPGWRLYVFRLRAGTACFRYNAHVYDERAGMGGYVFETGADCWHAIEAHGPRVSCGLKIPETLAQEIIDA